MGKWKVAGTSGVVCRRLSIFSYLPCQQVWLQDNPPFLFSINLFKPALCSCKCSLQFILSLCQALISTGAVTEVPPAAFSVKDSDSGWWNIRENEQNISTFMIQNSRVRKSLVFIIWAAFRHVNHHWSNRLWLVRYQRHLSSQANSSFLPFSSLFPAWLWAVWYFTM